VTFALVDSDDGRVIHTDTFGKQSGFAVPIAGPIVNPFRGNVFYFASGGVYQRYDNGSRVVPWDGTYGFDRPDFALQPGPEPLVVAVGAVGDGYGGTLEAYTTDHGKMEWQFFDSPQRSYSVGSFTDPTFTSIYYSVSTSAGGAFRGSMVSRDMATGHKRWEWTSSSAKGVMLLNAGARFINGTERFAPMVLWQTNSGNYTLTMVDDTTGESMWDFTTPWEACRWPLSVLATRKDPSSLDDTKIVFTCQGSFKPVVSHVLDPATGRELPAESGKLVPYDTNTICYQWSAGRNTVFRYGTNGEIVYARVT